MLIPALTDEARFQVAVRPESMRVAACCFVCERTDVSPVLVRFTRTLLLGVMGGIESTSLRVPLCPAHGGGYEGRMRMITKVQVVCAGIAALAFGSMFAAFPVVVNGHRQPGLIAEDAAQILAGIGIAAVVVAYASILLRATALPVGFRPRHHESLFRGYDAYVFRFADMGAASRFAAANR